MDTAPSGALADCSVTREQTMLPLVVGDQQSVAGPDIMCLLV